MNEAKGELTGPIVLEGTVKLAARLMVTAIVAKQEDLEAAKLTMLETVLVLLGRSPQVAENTTVSFVDDVITLLPKEQQPAVQPEPRK